MRCFDEWREGFCRGPGGGPVQPLASSPRPWRNMIVPGRVEGMGGGIVMGGGFVGHGLEF